VSVICRVASKSACDGAASRRYPDANRRDECLLVQAELDNPKACALKLISGPSGRIRACVVAKPLLPVARNLHRYRRDELLLVQSKLKGLGKSCVPPYLSQILDTVASLTPEQVNAAFKKWVDPAAISYQVAVK